MSAGNPFTMFSACVVLPPNDIWKISDWSCCSIQSVAKAPEDEVSLPYASYGFEYAARVMTGVSARVQSPGAAETTLLALPVAPPPEPHAVATRISDDASRPRRSRLGGRILIRAPFDRPAWSRWPRWCSASGGP